MRLDGVGKRYGLRQPWIVRDVSLEVAAGQLIRLEGRNGSGKSTLMRVIAGVTAPSAGRVSGRPHTGYVPERFPGALGFSARDYLGHMSRIHGLSGPAAAQAVTEWIYRLGAGDYAGSPLRTLSKGMCQKVALAQALIARPGLLVLDEAWTGLDHAARAALDGAVAERLAAGSTVFFVDHHQARLAGMVSQRWQLGAGGVQVLEGPGTAAEPEAARPSVVIEITGLEPESPRQLAAMPGVTQVSLVPGMNGGGRIAVQLTVTARESDTLLRQVLSWDDVHVAAVRDAS